MQAFTTPPTEAELARLLRPDDRSMMFRIEETPERLVVRPRGIPMWFAAFALLLPLGGMVVFVIWFGAPWFMIPGGAVAATMMLVLLRGLNCHIESKGPFLIVDKARRALSLPRLKMEANASHILGFVEVSAWHGTTEGVGVDYQWMAELSVLVRTEDDGLARYPVAECDSSESIAKLGRKLAEFFSVERKMIKMNWWTRRRLRRESVAEK